MRSKGHPILAQRKPKNIYHNNGTSISTLRSFLPSSWNENTRKIRHPGKSSRKKINVLSIIRVILLGLVVTFLLIVGASFNKNKSEQTRPIMSHGSLRQELTSKYKNQQLYDQGRLSTKDMDTDALSTYADNLRIEMPTNDIIHRRETNSDSSMSYDIENCPEYPPENYPMEWKLVDEILDHWNPNDVKIPIDGIYQGLCIFKTAEEAIHYREAEVPFVIRKDPTLLPTVHRWNSDPNYLLDKLGHKERYTVETSESNHLMFYRVQTHKKHLQKKGWKPPIQKVEMTYSQWLKKANVDQDYSPDDPHYYFRVNAKEHTHFLYNELPFFKPREKGSFYMVNPEQARGINCRFGMVGNLAECHYDGSRNFIIVMGGQRRYILSHPRSCSNLELYENGHPSARHSAVDWTLDTTTLKERYPSMIQAKANEVVLQAGDVLYLPSFWFHTIISLSLNWQCNARSGTTTEYTSIIKKCGFMT